MIYAISIFKVVCLNCPLYKHTFAMIAEQWGVISKYGIGACLIPIPDKMFIDAYNYM